MVGIIAANNLRFSPYIFYYTRLLDEIEIDYEVIFPNRNPEMIEPFNAKTIPIEWNKKRHSLMNYFFYSKKVKKISDKKYDFLIVLTTTNAVFCSLWLRKKYREKYIVDIRDYTYEYNSIFYKLEKKVLEKSKYNVISSEKFKLFLPESKYLICHNINTPLQKSIHSFKKKEGKIIVGYIGAISYEKQCKRFIDLVNSDERFEFHLYGTGISEAALRKYAKAYCNNRIIFFGKYNNCDKDKIIQNVDILFNVYGNGRPLVDYALSNKLYDALYYHKPLITSPCTYMEEMGGYMAFSLNLDKDNNLQKLWDWYHKLDNKIFDKYADTLYEKVMQQNRVTEETIKLAFAKE